MNVGAAGCRPAPTFPRSVTVSDCGSYKTSPARQGVTEASVGREVWHGAALSSVRCRDVLLEDSIFRRQGRSALCFFFGGSVRALNGVLWGTQVEPKVLSCPPPRFVLPCSKSGHGGDEQTWQNLQPVSSQNFENGNPAFTFLPSGGCTHFAAWHAGTHARLFAILGLSVVRREAASTPIAHVMKF